jgi:hypothetical protein
MNETWKPNWTITGLGSLPLADPREAVDLVLKYFPEIPFWPQLSGRGSFEDILLQFAFGLPGLLVDHQTRKVCVGQEFDRAAGLTQFYEADLAGETESLGLTPEQAPGFFEFVSRVGPGLKGIQRLKGQIVGPVLFCNGILDHSEGHNQGKPVIFDPELRAAYARGLGLKGAWQVANLPQGDDNPLIFIDDPGFYLLGSAFMPLSGEEAGELLNLTTGPIQDAGGLAGVHCCANTDWPVILGSGVDLVSLDAFGYGPEFVLFARDISSFLERGGIIAWGLVPTKEHTGKETPEGLAAHLRDLFKTLIRAGVDQNRLEEQALLTPACGFGSLSMEDLKFLLDLLHSTQRLLIS